MIQEVNLGTEALIYTRECLTYGNTLMRKLLELPLDSGRCTAFLSENFIPERVNEFKHGGATTRAAEGEVENANRAVASFVRGYLVGHKQRYAVFEDYVRERGSKFLQDDQYFVFNSEVYLFVDSQSGENIGPIRKAMKRASRYTFRAALTSLDSERSIKDRQAVSMEIIQEIAKNTEHILLGAYDEETYVLWSKRRG